MTHSYKHLKKLNNEIDKVIKEILELGLIRPNSSPYETSVVLVNNKDGTFRMCMDYRVVNKKTWKEHFHHLEFVQTILA